MGLRRLVLGFLVVTATALTLAFTAAAKEGVTATLTTRVPLTAAAGTNFRVSWTLTYRDKSGHRRPFGGGEIFVRLLSATHAGARVAFVDCSGSCSARIRVPKGGIRDVQIGIRGYRNGRPGLSLFPITNDPVPR